MIDLTFVEEANQKLLNSLKTGQEIWGIHLMVVKDCFTKECEEKIKRYIPQISESSWQLVSGQESRNRKAVMWESDTVVEELHMVFESVTGFISDRYRMSLNFHGIQIWQDGPGYCIGEHMDNPVIKVSLQIYLFGAEKNIGTSFRLPDGRWYEVDFEANTGYLLLNDHRSGITHKSTNPVSNHTLRHSVYAVWSLEPKRQ